MDLKILSNVKKVGTEYLQTLQPKGLNQNLYIWKRLRAVQQPSPLKQRSDRSEIADRFISLLRSKMTQNSLATTDSPEPRFRQCQDSAVRCQSDIQERRDGCTGLSIAAAPPAITPAGRWTSRTGSVARRLPDLGNLKQQDEPYRAELPGP
jgi:hypothetical protein